MLGLLMVTAALLSATLCWLEPASDETIEALEAQVAEIFEDECTMCHDEGGDPTDPGDLNLEVPPGSLIGQRSVVVDKPLVDPGNPANSYLLDKLYGSPDMVGDLMPPGGEPLPEEQLQAVEQWIASLPPAPDAPDVDPETPPREPPARRDPKPFRGTEQIVLPTTTTLGQRTLQFRVDHRFGRIGTERGAFGLDAGAIMSIGMAYGILDGWDVRLRRTNARKGWELGTKYVPVRQEDGMPLSFGMYVSMDWFRDFDVANQLSGNFMAMLSRLWFERWSTMLTMSYHLPTNHNPRVFVDLPDDDVEGPRLVQDRRGTMVLGLASSVWLGRRKQWGIDLEYFLPVPDGASPNVFYYRNGDADPGGTRIGSWALGGSYFTGKHLFQVFFTNNRQIHPNLAAPGGQTGNPFATVGDSRIPFNFFLGFNLTRLWSL
jgi:mono/diheme cytochrome c family protein